MKFKLQILFLFITLQSFSQTTINSINLDTTGLLKWSINVKPDEATNFSIQRKVGDKWVTITEEGFSYAEISIPGEPPSPPSTQKQEGSILVPVGIGITTYKIVITKSSSSKIISDEVSVIRTSPNKNKLFAQGDFIQLEQYNPCKIWNSNGILVKNIERTNSINISDLKKGLYYINFSDGKICEFEKK